jgi:Xaa-Pro aminopeptidase
MNHRDALARRRAAAAAAWKLGNEIVLIGAGAPAPMPGRGDQTFPFRAHSEYLYLARHLRPGSILAFDAADPAATSSAENGWTDFVPLVTEKERIWVGDVPNVGTPLDQLASWLEARRGRPLALLGTPPALPAELPGDDDLALRLREGLLQVRQPKDAGELELMRAAAAATAAGFAAAREHIRPGISERLLQVEIETAFFRAGATRTAYDSIVGSGPHAAVFHIAPSGRELQAGELVLIDAGADCDDYCCDVTRTYAVGGSFSAEQRDLYAIVLAAERAAIERCRAGVEYKQIHLDAARDLAAGLVDFGLLRGDPGALVEQGACALFFPHGIGHMVGLGVRDAGGRLPGREPDTRPGLENLRLDLPLAPGYVVTIEPGIYFVPALLQDAARREAFRTQVDWDRADGLIGFGGIRIEDNVLVTGGAPEVLTAAIPKDL